MFWLRQSTSTVVQFGPFVDPTDGVTPVTTLATAMNSATTGIRISKGGIAFAARGTATLPVHDAFGYYRTTLSAADTGTLGRFRMIYSALATNLPVWLDFMVVSAEVYDSTFGTVLRTANVTQWLGTAVITPTLAGLPKVDIQRVGGVAQDLPTATALATAQTDLNTITGTDGVTLATAQALYAPAKANDNMNLTFSAIDSLLDENLSIHQNQGTVGAAITLNLYDGSEGPGIFIDGAAANTATSIGNNGTIKNPVSTIAAATTIATSLGLRRFYLINATSVTLAQAYENWEFIGIGDIAANGVALGGQDVDNSRMENVIVSGAQGGTGRVMYRAAALNNMTAVQCMAWNCAIVGNITVRADCFFDGCWSAIAGSATPTLDINSVAGINIDWRHYSGGLQINNAVATTQMSYEADGQIVIDATCTSLTISVRGNCQITDNGTTTALTQDAAVNLTNVNAQVLDVLNVDTFAEPAQGVPAATTTFGYMIGFIYKVLRNKKTSTATEIDIFNSGGTVVDHKRTISDDGTTYTETEIVSGP